MPRKLPLHAIILAIMLALLIIPASTVTASVHTDPETTILNTASHEDHKHHDDDDEGECSCDHDGDDESPEEDDEGDKEPTDGDDSTEDPSEDPTPAPERTPIPQLEDEDDGEQIPAPYLDLAHSCSADGTTFTITNHGGEMQSTEHYALSDGSSGEYQLGWKESKTITTGFGAVSIDAGTAGSLSAECQTPAELTISAVCVPAAGVIFTVRNSGGPMLAPQAYTINNTTTDTFLLGTGGQIAIDAGFGDPVFFSEGLTTRLGSICNPVGIIMGMIWSDIDGDGIRDIDEPGLGDIEVSLVADGAPVTLKTAPDGLYRFEVVPGSYQLVTEPAEDVAPYLQLTADPDGSPDGKTTVTISEANPDFTGNFGYKATQTGSIGGIIWLETHNFGQRDGDETGLKATIIQLLDQESNIVQQFSVEADGQYKFSNLQPGEYIVKIVADELPPGSYATHDPDQVLDFESVLLVHPGEHIEDVDFGIVGTF